MTFTATRWTLDALLPSGEPEVVEKALQAFERKVKKVEGYRKALKKTIAAKDFNALLKDYEASIVAAYKVYAYASLRFSADTQDQAAMALLGQIQQRMAQAENRLLFFSLWWKALDDRNAQRLMKGAGDLTYWLEEMRHFKPHTLTEAEEKVINLKNVNGVQALDTIYEAITNKYVFNLEVSGEKKALTRDALMAYVTGTEAELRAAAYRELYRVFSEDNTVLAQIYSHIVRDWRSENVDLRKFKSPIAVRNLANDLPDTVVETILRVIKDNAGVFQRYFKLKAGWLGAANGRLRRYDLYAPLGGAEKDYDYDSAVRMVLDTFSGFSPRVGELARRVFDAGHVDAEVRHGKRGGAFCAGILPGLEPWVLLNYTGRPRDVATVAHEMGHAIHHMLAGGHSILTAQASLPLAETASVFSEILLTEKLLAGESDPLVRRDLLAKMLDDTYATVGRQGFFAMWEKEAHELVQQGKTADEMAARYLEALREQFGDAMEVGEEFRWEWIAIPHFYSSPFYVYAYSFGQLLVLALYEQYRREGEAFKPKYLKLLSYGGSRAPMDILTEAGINIKSAKFWQGAYDVISRMIDELEALDVGPEGRAEPAAAGSNGRREPEKA
jgi:oligoendopeptidase F